MEFDRVVQVFGNGRFGTGYLIAPRLVLTAGHATDGVLDVQVCLPDEGPRRFVSVVGWSKVDDVIDAALLEITDAGWKPPISWRSSQRPQRFGQLVTTAAGQRVTARGFPRMQRDADVRIDEQLDGTVSAGTGMLACRYEILSNDPATSVPADSSRYAGMSGAAVFSGDVLLGVIRKDRRPPTGTRLTATPIREILAESLARELITTHCRRSPVLEPAEFAHLLSSAVDIPALTSPASLLRAEVEAIGFRGRKPEQRQLLRWIFDTSSRLGVQVLTGPGGQGKTRLARRLMEMVREQGWSAGFLGPEILDGLTAPPIDLDPLAMMAGPMLMVVDYAESRPGLIRRLLECVRTSVHPMRVLLVARAAGPWLTDLGSATTGVGDLLQRAAEATLRLGPLDANAAGRTQTYNSAVVEFARVLSQVDGYDRVDWPRLVAQVPQPDALGTVRYESALSVQMAALVELLQQHRSTKVIVPVGKPEAALLIHEERYWSRTASLSGLAAVPTEELRLLVASLCLCGAANERQAVDTLRRLRQPMDDREIINAARWLRQLYPAPPSRYWGSMQPDRIAEFHASTMVRETSDLLSKLLADATQDQQIQAVTVLSRAAIAHSNADRRDDSEAVLGTLHAALRLVSDQPGVLQGSYAALPGSTDVLSSFALALAEAVSALYRRLATNDPDTHQADLATSLCNLSTEYGRKGRHEEALNPITEAVSIFRVLASSRPDLFRNELARSLTLLAIRLGAVGLQRDGVSVAEEALGIRRRLADDNPDAYDPPLAASLIVLSNQYAAMGLRREGIATVNAAVMRYRRLAANAPDAYEPALAGALMNLSIQRDAIGKHVEALAAYEESIGVYRQLVTENPDAYESTLAAALLNGSNRYVNVGRNADSLAAIEEAVEIYRRKAQADSLAYEPDLALALNNLAVVYQQAGRLTDSRPEIERAIDIYRRFVSDNQGFFEPRLATALIIMSDVYSATERADEAVKAADEAVAIRRRYLDVSRAIHEPALAAALVSTADRHAALGQTTIAVAAAKESVSIYRRLVLTHPEIHQLGLANALHVNARVEAGLQHRMLEGLDLAKESTTIYAQWASQYPGEHYDDFGAVLALAADILENRGLLREPSLIRKHVDEGRLVEANDVLQAVVST